MFKLSFKWYEHVFAFSTRFKNVARISFVLIIKQSIKHPSACQFNTESRISRLINLSFDKYRHEIWSERKACWSIRYHIFTDNSVSTRLTMIDIWPRVSYEWSRGICITIHTTLTLSWEPLWVNEFWFLYYGESEDEHNGPTNNDSKVQLR